MRIFSLSNPAGTEAPTNHLASQDQGLHRIPADLSHTCSTRPFPSSPRVAVRDVLRRNSARIASLTIFSSIELPWTGVEHYKATKIQLCISDSHDSAVEPPTAKSVSSNGSPVSKITSTNLIPSNDGIHRVMNWVNSRFHPRLSGTVGAEVSDGPESWRRYRLYSG